MANNNNNSNKRQRTNTHRRENDAAKKSLIDKVNAEKEHSQRPSKQAKSSLINKVNSSNDLLSKDNSKKINTPNYKKTSASINKETKQQPNKSKKNINHQKSNSKYRNWFFFKLSKIGRVMLVIYVVGIIIFSVLLTSALINKGHIIYGSRPEPSVIINEDKLNQIKKELSDNFKDTDSINVDYRGYRLVVVIDLKNNASLDNAKKVNENAYRIIDKITPIKEYFSNKDNILNNDLYIYSTDVVPSDYKTNSKFIYETYKNSKMANALSYNLTTPRDEASAKEVIKTMK
ncbi:MAG: hypothetical protein LBT75_00430 [Bacilli bacterium]|jgi:hypothetical protein|nr:hypothetical protein [Bacilli bacterium]